MHRPIGYLSALLIIASACNAPSRTGLSGLISTTGGSSWTILCLEASDQQHRTNTEALADGLRNCRQLDRAKVTVQHDSHVSRIYYGTYRNVPDKRTGSPRPEPRCAKDLRFIRSLAVGTGYPFIYARPMPAPTDQTGPPQWDLRRTHGVYSLQICYCNDKPGFPDRRQGALAIVRQLRQEGAEAYYYHGPLRSLVCVGIFDAAAVTETGTGIRRYRQDVIDLQNSREEFKYNTEWLQKVYRILPDRKRQVQYSFLVEIPRSQELFE